MAIVKMKKFNLMILDSHKERLLRGLQVFRNVQFEEYNDFKDDTFLSDIDIVGEQKTMEDIMSKCNYVIDLVSKYSPTLPTLKQFILGLPNYTYEEMKDKAEDFNFAKVYNDVKNVGDELFSVEAQISKKREKIRDLRPIENLDISFEDLKKPKKFTAVIGGVNYKLKDDFLRELLEVSDVYFEKVGEASEEAIYLVIYDNRVKDKIAEVMRYSNFNVMNMDNDKPPAADIAELEEDIKRLEEKKEELIRAILGFNEQLEDFKVYYEYVGNLYVKALAKEKFKKTSKVCFIKGFTPEKNLEKFEEVISSKTGGVYSLELSDVDPLVDDVPIILENNWFVRTFEGITETYALPRYNEVDPTPYYALFYAFFFGMMSADFGYGAVLFILTTLALKFANMTPAFRKNVKFFQLISISTAIWGFLYGSYFGHSIPGMWRLLDLSTQFMTVLVVSIAIGGINLFYALGIKGYMLIRDKKYVDAIFDVASWYVSLIGIILLLLGVAKVLSPEITTIGKYLMIVGFVMLFVGGARSSEGSIPAKCVSGLYNIYGISGYVGDFVSYSRLMALGMSGGYIAFAINMIAGMVIGKGIIGVIAAIIILVFFHAFNLFLACLGAYVHALRLTYVEFFQKFYEGGGKAFEFYRNKPKYINLDRHLED